MDYDDNELLEWYFLQVAHAIFYASDLFLDISVIPWEILTEYDRSSGLWHRVFSFDHHCEEGSSFHCRPESYECLMRWFFGDAVVVGDPFQTFFVFDDSFEELGDGGLVSSGNPVPIFLVPRPTCQWWLRVVFRWDFLFCRGLFVPSGRGVVVLFAEHVELFLIFPHSLWTPLNLLSWMVESSPNLCS